jgi:hypothetical protein
MPLRCRLLLIAISLLTCLLLAGGIAWLRTRQTAITSENAARIKEGMKLVEVEAILGGPPRDDALKLLAFQRADGSKVAMSHSELSQFLVLDEPWTKHWLSDEVLVEITFDDAGRVTSCAVEPVRIAGESPLATLRRWLGL